MDVNEDESSVMVCVTLDIPVVSDLVVTLATIDDTGMNYSGWFY